MCPNPDARSKKINDIEEGNSMIKWDESEWAFCLFCFYHATNIDAAVKEFQKKYKRSKDSILSRFKHHGMRGSEFVGNKMPKSRLVNELKRAFSHFKKALTPEDFSEFSHIDYQTVIGHFGSWQAAIQEAGLLSKFKSSEKVKQEKTNFDPEKEIEEAWKKEKENILRKVEKKKISLIKNQENKLELLNEMIISAVADAEPPVVKYCEASAIKLNKEQEHITLWLEFSDLQLGTLITAEEMGGINAHNWPIWQEKLTLWKDTVIKKIDAHRRQYIIDYVIIAGLGDFVEGANIFKGQEWKVDKNCVDQAIFGANDVSSAFIEIFLTFPSISFQVLEVFGNHGRIGGKGEQPYSCSLDKVFLRMLEMQICKTKVNNYVWHRNESWFYLINLYGWNHLLLHGDQGMGGLWSSRPTINGLEKGVVRWSQMLQQQIHFLHIGHFHQEAALSFNRSNILINGSFIGTSDFAAKVMVASSPPIQVMHVFEPSIGLSKTERIYLTGMRDNDTVKSIKPSIAL